ncbi:MAG: hypothetical protein IJV81_09275 [Paludibacteraceae bacterium]|nr:hypothetical protein [Paludibacteraceae bacterium]
MQRVYNRQVISSAQSSAHENFFSKKTPKREALVINTFRLLYAPFYSNIYKSSAQKQQNAEDTALQYIEA